MYDIHIEEFYGDCARILLQLYMSFPRKHAVFVEDIAGPDMPDEYGIHSARFQSCFGAMIWLEAEGYLSSEALIRQEAIDQASLTAKGLRLLTQMSDRLEEHDHLPKRAPNVEHIRQMLKHGTSTQMTQLMIHLIEHHR